MLKYLQFSLIFETVALVSHRELEQKLTEGLLCSYHYLIFFFRQYQ